MGLNTVISFGGYDYVVVTVTNGGGVIRPMVVTTVTWPPQKMKLVQPLDIQPPGYHTTNGSCYWDPIEIPVGSYQEYSLKMCRNGLVNPTVLAEAVNQDDLTDTGNDDREVPPNFHICGNIGTDGPPDPQGAKVAPTGTGPTKTKKRK